MRVPKKLKIWAGVRISALDPRSEAPPTLRPSKFCMPGRLAFSDPRQGPARLAEASRPMARVFHRRASLKDQRTVNTASDIRPGHILITPVNV